MGNLSKREKTLVIIGTILIVIYLYFSFFLSPVFEKVKVENNIIKDKRSQEADIEKVKLSNITNNKKLEGLKTKFNEAVKELPKNERNPEIARNLNIMAEKSNVSINSVTFGGAATAAVSTTKPSTTAVDTGKTTVQSSNVNQKLIIVPVSIITNGDYLSLLSFTSNIEGDGRLAQIDSISVNLSSKTDKSNILQSNIVINYYFTEGTIEDKPTYDFKDDKAGKDNLFN